MTVQTQTLTYRCPHCGTTVEVDPGAACSILTCPAPTCGKPFRIDAPKAEPVLQPPHLVMSPGSEPVRSSAPEQPVASATPAAPAAVPTAPTANGTSNQGEPMQAVAAPTAVLAAPAPEPEETTHVIHLSMFRRYPFRVLGYLLLLLAGLAGVIEGLSKDWHWLTAIGAIVLVLCGGRFFLWWLRMHVTTLTLTNRRLILRTGVFSRESIEIELAQITDFYIQQGLLMRWLNVGDLAIVGSNAAHPQVVIMAVPDPHGIGAFLQGNIAVQKQREEQPQVVVVQQPAATQGTPVPTA